MSTGNLPSDIERALQHAVGLANKAYSDSEHVAEEKRKKRQKRTSAEGDAGLGAKRKKRRTIVQAEELSTQPPAIPTSSNADPSPSRTQHEPRELRAKKSKKVWKEKDGSDACSGAPPFATTGPAPSSDAFVDAVLNAASQASRNDLRSEHPARPSTSVNPVSLADASPEDMMNILQSLDMSKLDDVLKDVGSSARAANVNVDALQTVPLVPSAGSSQKSTASRTRTSSSGKPAAKRARVTRQRKSSKIAAPVELNSADTADLLATKWLRPKDLEGLAKDENVIVKRGKFSASEDEQLLGAIDKYRQENSLTEDQIQSVIFPQRGEKDKTFWAFITRAVPMRPVTAVYHHVRRIYHPLGMQGRWTPTEDQTLVDAVLELGQKWEKVSERVGRTATDCRDRYRNKVQHQDTQALGRWTKEEEDKLIKIVEDLTVKRGKDSDHDVFWTVVAERMGHTRSRQQCRNKWVDTLSKRFKTDESEIRWTARDAFILVAKVDSLDVQDDTEIDWKTLPDPHWNLWSPHILQRRWATMKRSIRGHEDMSHDEIVGILREKKAYVPSGSSTPDSPMKPKSKGMGSPMKFKSKEMVSDSDDDEDRQVEDHLGST